MTSCTNTGGAAKDARGVTGLTVNQPVRVIDNEACRIVVESQGLSVALPVLPENLAPCPHEHHGGGN